MDIVLDVIDTLAFDRLYATIFPVNQTQLTPSPDNDLLSAYNQHLGRYVVLQPSAWAVRSGWSRDDLRRQALSLFLITWCVSCPRRPMKHDLHADG
jgi:lathosterol oxidase